METQIKSNPQLRLDAMHGMIVIVACRKEIIGSLSRVIKKKVGGPFLPSFDVVLPRTVVGGVIGP
jgi:hypothetical protein